MPCTRSLRLALTTLLLIVALGGCGGSSSSSSPVSAPVGSPPASGATGSTSATGGAAPSGTATTVRARACVASVLSLRYLGQQGAAGHGELGFALRNSGASTCRTFGYPGILFLDKQGNPLPTKPTRVTHDLAGTATASALHVAPDASVSFRLFVSHGITSSAGCTTAYGLQVIPPDDTTSVRVEIPDGAYECGDATVTPLQPGVSAYGP